MSPLYRRTVVILGRRWTRPRSCPENAPQAVDFRLSAMGGGDFKRPDSATAHASPLQMMKLGKACRPGRPPISSIASRMLRSWLMVICSGGSSGWYVVRTG